MKKVNDVIIFYHKTCATFADLKLMFLKEYLTKLMIPSINFPSLRGILSVSFNFTPCQGFGKWESLN